MNRLNQLPEIANKALGGVNAGPEMKQRILAAASQQRRPRAARRPMLAAAACTLVLVLALSIGVPSLTRTGAPIDTNVGPLITTQAAGSGDVHNERALLDLNPGAVTITKSSGVPKYRSIWEEGKNAFPLIGVNGRYYRMLTSPSAVDASLLGSSVGTVNEFTTDPALSGTDSIVSNKLPSGTQVYPVSSMGGTLVAAELDGAMRLFQRVSFNGSALRGSEKLADTLQISGHVIAMELSDVGTITDSSMCSGLISTLMKNASYESSGSVTATQSLLIALDNGLTLQLGVKNDKLAGCGVWSCPEFIEAFEAAVK